jgi:hypothetical protein
MNPSIIVKDLKYEANKEEREEIWRLRKVIRNQEKEIAGLREIEKGAKEFALCVQEYLEKLKQQ